jgi:phosphoglycerate dehydrogenase-like enzyme
MLREAGFGVILPDHENQLTEEQLLGKLPGVAATLAGSEPYVPRVFARCPQLRVIARLGVGYDAVDLQAATASGVVVTTTPGCNHDAVAEQVMALLLAVLREVVPQDRDTKAGKWRRISPPALRGKTLGIVGLGRIGKAVASRARAFGVHVVAFEPLADQEFVARHEVRLLSFDELLRQSDIVSLHVPLSPETRHLINRHTLGLMKRGAYLVNTARGGLVCEKDLIEALRSKHLAGAALDVFEEEPARSNPLFAFDNVVTSPHTAGVDEQSLLDMAKCCAEAIISLSRGEWPDELVVNKDVRSKFRW